MFEGAPNGLVLGCENGLLKLAGDPKAPFGFDGAPKGVLAGTAGEVPNMLAEGFWRGFNAGFPELVSEGAPKMPVDVFPNAVAAWLFG